MAASAKKNDPAQAEANAAASDAARDARDEALANAETSKKAISKLKKAKDEATAAAKATWKDFVVDVWITDFNSIEFGFWKRDRNRGKSRQFTTDMDVFAEIVENGERTGVLGYRKELWKEQEGTKKRLVFKLFSETLNWRASMDLMLGRSIQQTIGARGIPVTTYAINTANDDVVIYLERSANKWPLLPEHFSFFTLDNGTPKFYRIKRDVINIGGDYTLYDQSGDVVGHLDGAILTLGGKWRGSVRSDHADARVMTVMKLFAGLIVFNRAAKRHVKSVARDIRDGRLEPDIDHLEADLYLNPRRVR